MYQLTIGMVSTLKPPNSAHHLFEQYDQTKDTVQSSARWSFLRSMLTYSMPYVSAMRRLTDVVRCCVASTN